MKNIEKKYVGMVLVGFIIVVTLLMAVLSGCDTVDNETFDQVVEIDEKGEIQVAEGQEEAFEDIAKDINLPSEKSIVSDIHEMANTVVVASQKWGKKEMSEERINALILQLKAGEDKYENGEKLLEILTKWKQGDFSKAHHDHNFVWDLLNGTVGKAKSVDWDNIPEWAKDKN